MESIKPRITIPFELLPEGKFWKVGQTYRVRMVLKQVATGEQDATYEVIDATSLEASDAGATRFLRSEGGHIKI